MESVGAAVFAGVSGIEDALDVGNEAATGVSGHEGGDFVDVGDHGEAAVVAEAFLEDLDGIEIGLGRGVGLELAEEVAVQIVELMAAFGALAEVTSVGVSDLREGTVVEVILAFEPGHAKSESGLAGGEIHGLAREPESSEPEKEKGGGKRNEARNRRVHDQRAAKWCL